MMDEEYKKLINKPDSIRGIPISRSPYKEPSRKWKHGRCPICDGLPPHTHTDDETPCICAR